MNLPAYTNPWGEPSERQYPMFNSISPFQVTKESPRGEALYQARLEKKMDARQEKAIKESFERNFESGQRPPETEVEGLQILFKAQEIADMPTGTAFERIKREKKAYSKVDDILDSDLIDDTQKTQLLESLGISKEDADYYQVAKLSNDEKQEYVLEQIATIARLEPNNRHAMLEELAKGRRLVNGKLLVANGVLDDLEDMGLISASEKKMLKDLKIKDGEVLQDLSVSGRGSGARLKKLTKAEINARLIDAPKARATTGGGARALQLQEAPQIQRIAAKSIVQPNMNNINQAIARIGQSATRSQLRGQI